MYVSTSPFGFLGRKRESEWVWIRPSGSGRKKARYVLTGQNQAAIYPNWISASTPSSSVEHNIHPWAREEQRSEKFSLCISTFPPLSGKKPLIYSCREPPRWRVLPPEIVHIIMEMLGTDKKTLSACALVSREFTFAALCFIGRHLTINTSHRLQECVNLLTNGSRLAAFQHVRSLDIGITSKRIVQQQRYWDDYLIILDVFARRRYLTRLWLSEVPFCFSDSGMRDRARNVLISLTSTVNDLGIYSCHFSSYPDIVSLIRSFPLCTSLYVRDCVVRGGPGSNVFAGLPQHTLRISDLELTSSPGYRPTVDLSTLIKDTALDISSLTRFSCSMTTADQARRALMFATASPIESLQFICEEAEGFHGTSTLSGLSRLSRTFATLPKFSQTHS